MSQPPTPIPPSAETKKLLDAGNRALTKGKLLEAETAFAQAISLDESNADCWIKLGLVWSKMNRHIEAIDANTMALTLAPNHPDALYNLGLSHLHQGDEDRGIDYLQQSHRAKPDSDLADKLADHFFRKHDFMTAAYYDLKDYKEKKNTLKEARLYRLASSLYNNGDMVESLAITLTLFKKNKNSRTYTELLYDLFKVVPFSVYNQDGRDALEFLLKEENSKLLFLRNPWVSLFLLNPDYQPIKEFVTTSYKPKEIKVLSKILRDDILCLGLQKGLAISSSIENILTNIRSFFLLNWDESKNWPEGLLKFMASLAVNCWYNDYVYYETPDEKETLKKLQAHLTNKLNTNTDKELAIDTLLQISLLACYIPLYEFLPQSCLDKIPSKFAKDMSALIKAQMIYPAEEQSIKEKIPSFCKIDDETSLLVQSMYSARPYPRWISTIKNAIPKEIMQLTSGLDVLIAGCGTGQEPAVYARSMPEAHLTAIDLSPSSLAYGKRMAIKLGIDHQIDFLHGDLMKARDLGKKFDLVTSSGVLHHLKDPEKGLAAILETLKPDGRLSLSLYSKTARDFALNPALEYIKEKNYSSSVDDIRQFRHDVLNMNGQNPITRCAKAGDFFYLSECNDLLFHVQEHRYTPFMIWEMAERHNLIPFSIKMTPERKKAFETMFPGQSPLNPELLDQFEKEHTNAFIEMYNVFFYKKGAKTSQPIDRLIFSGLI